MRPPSKGRMGRRGREGVSCMVVMTKNGNLHVKDRVPGRFLPMTNGPVLVHAVRHFRRCDPRLGVVLILPRDRRRC